MAKVQLTRIEVLDHQYRGLQHYVDASFDRGITGPEVAEGLRQKFRITIPLPTIYSYRMNRWGRRHLRVENLVDELDAFAEVMKKRPERDVRGILIYKKLFKMSSSELTRRDLEMRRVDAQNRKLEIEDKRAENQGKALRTKLEDAKASRGRDREKARHTPARAKDEDELRKKIDEIYGIGAAAPSPAPVSGKVDR